MNTNFQVIGLTRLGIKPNYTAPEADALTTRPSELLNFNEVCLKFVQNALKWPLQYEYFEKFSGRACPPDPLEFFFLFLNLLQIVSAGKNYA